jgi:hypothetical protein
VLARYHTAVIKKAVVFNLWLVVVHVCSASQRSGESATTTSGLGNYPGGTNAACSTCVTCLHGSFLNDLTSNAFSRLYNSSRMTLRVSWVSCGGMAIRKCRETVRRQPCTGLWSVSRMITWTTALPIRACHSYCARLFSVQSYALSLLSVN